MSDEFQKIQLSMLADITMGQSPDSINYNDDEKGLAFLQGCADFGFRYPTPQTYVHPPLKLAKKNSVLVSVRAPVGKINWSDRDYCIGRGLCSIKAKENNADTSFLKYALIQNEKFLHRRSQGSTFLAISFNDLSIFPIPDITVNAQKKIALILETIDQTIEKTEALIQKYQHIKQGLMHDLFTRGVTPDGKIRPPRKQAPELYTETSIGWFPKEWRLTHVGFFVKSAEYGISTSLMDIDSGIPVLRMNNIQKGHFDVTDLKYSFDLDAFALKLKKGDVLYNRTNSMEHVGKAAIWNENLPQCSFASYLVRLNLNPSLMIPEFFIYWINQDSTQNAIRCFATPAVQQVNINPTNLQKVLICSPKSLEEQKDIAIKLQSIDNLISEEKKLQSKLLKKKSGLMHDLLTGKVRVRTD